MAKKSPDELNRQSFALFEKIPPGTLSLGMDRFARELQNDAEQLRNLTANFAPFVARRN